MPEGNKKPFCCIKSYNRATAIKTTLPEFVTIRKPSPSKNTHIHICARIHTSYVIYTIWNSAFSPLFPSVSLSPEDILRRGIRFSSKPREYFITDIIYLPEATYVLDHVAEIKCAPIGCVWAKYAFFRSIRSEIESRFYFETVFSVISEDLDQRKWIKIFF